MVLVLLCFLPVPVHLQVTVLVLLCFLPVPVHPPHQLAKYLVHPEPLFHLVVLEVMHLVILLLLVPLLLL
jgi:hypothetical protein